MSCKNLSYRNVRLLCVQVAEARGDLKLHKSQNPRARMSSTACARIENLTCGAAIFARGLRIRVDSLSHDKGFAVLLEEDEVDER